MGIVFLSYRREDSQFATDRIYEHLCRRFSRSSIFKDVDNIPFGINFADHIATAVRSSDVMLVIIGPGWLSATTPEGTRRLDDPGDFVRVEIETAFANRIPVLPVLLAGARMPPAALLPPSLGNLATINAINVRADPDFYNDVKRLVGAVEQIAPPARFWTVSKAAAAASAALAAVVAGLYASGSIQPPAPPGSPAATVGACRDVTFVDGSKMPPVTTTRRVCN